MTQAKKKRSSSDKTAESRSETELLDLAQVIARELEAEGPGKLLENWMATRIAELIDESEHGRTRKAREEAKRECANIVFQFERKRRSEQLIHALNVLSTQMPTEYSWTRCISDEDVEPQDDLSQGIRSLRLLSEFELQVLACAQLSITSEESVKGVLVDEAISPELRDSLFRFSEHRESILNKAARELDIPDLLSSSEEIRHKAIIELLNRIHNDRKTILATLDQGTN